MFRLWLPVLVYMGAIFYASSLSSPPTPEDVSDKTLHLVTYAGLAALLVRAFAGARWSRVTLGVLASAVAVTVLYGVSDEWHQTWTEGRTPELADVGADAAGALIAAAVAGSCGTIVRLWRSRTSSSSARVP